MSESLKPPFQYFGGKRKIADEVWARFGSPRQYIEPFCGSLAVLLAAPTSASLEVIGDTNGFVANFWRAVVHQADAVAAAADSPASHIDLCARHSWLMKQREALSTQLADPNWHGDAKCAGWWLWGQCCWNMSGWCSWEKNSSAIHRVADVGAWGGVHAIGKIPNVINAGMGIHAIGKIPKEYPPEPEMWTSAGRTALVWLRKIAARLERVRVVHCDWRHTLINSYGKDRTAIFFDPPYEDHDAIYASGQQAKTVANDVADWCRDAENACMKIALCGHSGDHELPGWSEFRWKRKRLSYAKDNQECFESVWFSPACDNQEQKPDQADLFKNTIGENEEW